MTKNGKTSLDGITYEKDDLFGKLYNSMDFSRHDWEGFSYMGYGECDLEIRQTTKEKITMLYVPMSDKEATYSTYKLTQGNPFKAVKNMILIDEGISEETAKKLLEDNLKSGGRDIIIFFPNAQYETVDVYAIEKTKYENETKHNTTEKLVELLSALDEESIEFSSKGRSDIQELVHQRLIEDIDRRALLEDYIKKALGRLTIEEILSVDKKELQHFFNLTIENLKKEGVHTITLEDLNNAFESLITKFREMKENGVPDLVLLEMGIPTPTPKESSNPSTTDVPEITNVPEIDIINLLIKKDIIINFMEMPTPSPIIEEKRDYPKIKEKRD